jgi:alcohol dehydrogenase class IV
MVPRDLAHIIQSGYHRDERSLAELSHGNSERPAPSTPPARPGVILDNSNNILRDLVETKILPMVILDKVVRQMAADALASGSPGNNPRIPSEQEIVDLYYSAYE